MPHLNWRDPDLSNQPQVLSLQEVRPEPISHNPDHVRMLLAFTPEQRDVLHTRLQEVLIPSGAFPELRVDLPKNWAMFWKLREGESRLLIAHPAPDEWVMTAALSADHAAAFLAELQTLGPTPLNLSRLGKIARVSNMELQLQLG